MKSNCGMLMAIPMRIPLRKYRYKSESKPIGIPTTVRKTKVRSQKCECQQCERDHSANETKKKKHVRAAVSSTLPRDVLLGKDIPAIDAAERCFTGKRYPSQTKKPERNALVVTGNKAREEERRAAVNQVKEMVCGVKPRELDELAQSDTDETDAEYTNGTLRKTRMAWEGWISVMGNAKMNSLTCSRSSSLMMICLACRRRKRRNPGLRNGKKRKTGGSQAWERARNRKCGECQGKKLWSCRNQISLCVIAWRNPKRIRKVRMPWRIFTRRMGICTATGNPNAHMRGSATMLVFEVECTGATGLTTSMSKSGIAHGAQHSACAASGKREDRRSHFTTFLLAGYTCRCRNALCTMSKMPINSSTGQSGVPLVSMPVVSEPLALLAMDIVGPLERTVSGNKYILVLADYATRYPEAILLR